MPLPSTPCHPPTPDNHSSPHSSSDHQSPPPHYCILRAGGFSPTLQERKLLGPSPEPGPPGGVAAHSSSKPAGEKVNGLRPRSRAGSAPRCARFPSHAFAYPHHPAPPKLPAGPSAGPLSPGNVLLFSTDEDLEPQNWCCRWNDKPSFCALYQQRRPRIGCAGYRPPRPGEAAGAGQRGSRAAGEE